MASEMPERIWATPLGEPDGGFWYSPCADKTDKTEYVLATTHQRTLEALRDLVQAADKAVGHITGYGEASTARLNLRAALARIKGDPAP